MDRGFLTSAFLTQILTHLLYWSLPQWLSLTCQRVINWKAEDTLTFHVFDLLLPPPPHHLPFFILFGPLTTVSPLWGLGREIYCISSAFKGNVCEQAHVCPSVCDCLFVHTLLKAAWVAKDSDSLQGVLDKEWTTKKAVETIFSLPPLELCGQAGSSRGDEDQFPCRAMSSAVFLMPTYYIKEEEEMRVSEEKPCCIFFLCLYLNCWLNYSSIRFWFALRKPDQ